MVERTDLEKLMASTGKIEYKEMDLLSMGMLCLNPGLLFMDKQKGFVAFYSRKPTDDHYKLSSVYKRVQLKNA